MKSIDLTNQKFGKLTAISRVKGSKWLCLCECGNTKEIRTNSLTRGSTISCGCYHKEEVAKRHTTHNRSKDRLYHEWQYLKRRCYNPGYKYYERYGGRGISVCEEWKNNFVAFKEWAESNGYDDSLTLDRIDYDGNYEPDNCRWVTRKVQQNNRSSNLFFTIDGETKTLAQWCEIYKVPHERTRYRVKHGWDIVTALTAPTSH